MKIALLGYGRMGKMIDRLATDAGHEIVLRTSDPEKEKARLATAEVAIEFSQPEVALDNIRLCLEAGVAVVCGTTGWLSKGVAGNQRFGPVAKWVEERQGAFFYASNFSIGVNVFFQLNRELARMMKSVQGYSVGVEEIHHIHKADAPSGTAITLAEDLIAEHASFESWELDREIWPDREQAASENMAENVPPATSSAKKLPITAYRIGETPGTHRIFYGSEEDRLQIEHQAHGRVGFAKGAIAAAEWLKGRKGIFGMEDLLGMKR
jgi:4-hydroxy-tetrahydrodipicolinate reductase